MDSPIQEYHLLHVEDYQGARTYSLNAETVSIGRDSSNGIVIDDPLVSRHHACLIRVSSQTTQHLYEIVDGDGSEIRSQFGIYVNQTACERKILTTADRIQIGSTRFCYLLARMTPAEYSQYFDAEHIMCHSC